MTIDRIVRITIRFENAKGTDSQTRVCEMDPATTFIKSTQPQGKNPGNLSLQGLVLNQEDINDN